jgi:hypothetical protein
MATCWNRSRASLPLARAAPSPSQPRALFENTELDPAVVVKKSLEIAGDICIYTNQNHLIETLEKKPSRLRNSSSLRSH